MTSEELDILLNSFKDVDENGTVKYDDFLDYIGCPLDDIGNSVAKDLQGKGFTVFQLFCIVRAAHSLCQLPKLRFPSPPVPPFSPSE